MAIKPDIQRYIPPGFDLKNYADALNLNLRGWHFNLEIRRPPIFKPMAGHCARYGVLEVKGGLPAGRRDPVCDLPCAYVLSMQYKMAKSVELSKLVDNYNNTDLAISTKAVEQLKQIPAKPFLTPPDSYKLFPDVAPVMIDLDYSEDEIKKAFSEWLASAKKQSEDNGYRQRRERKLTEFNDKVFNSWRRCKVLPYLDLVNWNKVMGQSITNEIIAEILDTEPHTISGDTKLVALKLIKLETLKRMELQFTIEQG